MDQRNYVTRVVIPMISDHDAILMEVTPTSVSNKLPLEWLINYKCEMRIGLCDASRIHRFKEALKKISWNDLLVNRPQGQCVFDAFFSHLQETLDKFFPVKEKRTNTLGKNSKPKPRKSIGPRTSDWYTPNLRRLNELMLTLRSRGYEAEYLRAKKIYNKKVEDAKRAGNVKFIENSNNQCKAAWDIINSVRPSREGMRCAASPDEFNNFFISSVVDIVDSVPDAPSDPLDLLKEYMPAFQPDPCKTAWKKIKKDKVLKIISGLKSTASRDYYGWSTKLLKDVAEVIAAPLTWAINDSLQLGAFPSLMKIARTVPVYKKGDPASLASYRPISLVPVLGKVLERVIKEQTCDYFESNKIFSNSQHGFRKGRSTTGAVSVIADEIANAFEDSDSVSLTLCDLSRAFDCVPHKILVDKLSAFGVKGKALSMLSSYLADRRQVVDLKGAKSTEKEVPHGVPQGSVLGPLLFLIAINDLGWYKGLVLFADDTTLYSRGRTPILAAEEAENQLNGVEEWFRANKLQLNEAKTNRMTCTLARTPDDIGGSVKLLGFHLDPKLNWSDHVTQVCARLARVIYLLRRLKKCVTSSYLVLVYHAMFHCHISYGIHLWGHAAGSAEVLKLQKKAVRIITSSQYLEHCKPIFQRLGILTIFSHYIWACLLEIKNSEHGRVARADIHSHNTRGRNQLDVPRTRLSRNRDSYPGIAIRFFNRLPDATKTLDSKTFGNTTGNFFRKTPFYSVDEFLEDNLEGLKNLTV